MTEGKLKKKEQILSERMEHLMYAVDQVRILRFQNAGIVVLVWEEDPTFGDPDFDQVGSHVLLVGSSGVRDGGEVEAIKSALRIIGEVELRKLGELPA